MFCPNCGKSLPDDARFCAGCGNAIEPVADTEKTVSDVGFAPIPTVQEVEQSVAPIEPAVAVAEVEYVPEQQFEEPKAEKKKMSGGKKALIVIIAILVVIIGVGVTGLVMYFGGAGLKAANAMKNGDYDEALSLYHDSVRDNTIQKMIFEKNIEGFDKTVTADYEKGSLKYDDAVEALNALDEMGFDNAKGKSEEITDDKKDEDSLKAGNDLLAAGNYEGAIKEYSKIAKDSKSYDAAQKKLDELYPKYIDQTVATAVAYKSTGDFIKTLDFINDAYSLFPADVDKSKLDTIKNTALAEYKTYINGEIQKYIDDEDYAGALDIINDALTVDENDDFKATKTDLEQQYVASVTEKVNKYIKADDYVSAASVVESGLTVLPGNAALKSLKDEVARVTPTYLLDEHEPYSSSYYAAYVNGETFKSATETYTNGFRLTDNGSAHFNINAEYESLRFTLGHIDETDSYDAVVKIYCDGKLKKEIELTDKDLPKPYTVDITGVRQLEFSINVEYSDDDAHYGFGNVIVK